MPATADPLQTRVPRSKTALLQLIQLLVIRGHTLWIGGRIAPAKFPGFVAKMAARYPIARTARGRAYDRVRGLASVHFVVYPSGDKAAWFILSTAGQGGLADPACEDAPQARQALAAGQHIVFEDYVLLYAHKLSIDPAGVRRHSSTWTWRLTDTAFMEQKAAIERTAAEFVLGSESKGYGVRGILAMLRRRPLFSGVRRQVIALHRIAADEWAKVHRRWLNSNAWFEKEHGKGAWPLPDPVHLGLPKMPRLPLYDEPPRTVVDVVSDSEKAR